MSEALGSLYGTIDSYKRRLADALRNPRLALEQVVGNANDRARNVNEMTAAAAKEGADFGPASRRLANAMADAYNPAGIFIGPESKLWNPKAAFDATKLAAKKADPKEIWVRTGTFKSPDGSWKQEIDDSGAKFIGAEGIAAKAQALRARGDEIKQLVKPNKAQPDLFPKELTAARRPLKQEAKEINQQLDSYFGPTQMPQSGNLAPYAYEHSALYEAYPELRKVVVRQGKSDPGLYGSYQGDALRGTGQLDVTSAGLKNDPRSTATHEMQHAVQDIEGFAEGGSPMDFAIAKARAFDQIKQINDQLSHFAKKMDTEADPVALDALKNQYQDAMYQRAQLQEMAQIDPTDAYRRLAGEAESRAVQKRLDYTPEQRRQVFPLDDYDVPLDEIIVRRNGIIEALRKRK